MSEETKSVVPLLTAILAKEAIGVLLVEGFDEAPETIALQAIVDGRASVIATEKLQALRKDAARVKWLGEEANVNDWLELSSSFYEPLTIANYIDAAIASQSAGVEVRG